MTDGTSMNPSTGSPVWARSTLLDGLPEPLTRAVVAHIDQQAYRAGQRVFAAGDPCRALYIVQEGQFLAEGNPPYTLAPSESIGEVELLTGAPFEQGLVAQTDGVLYVLTRDDFIALGREHPALTLSLVEDILPHLTRPQVADILGVLRGDGLADPQPHLVQRATVGGAAAGVRRARACRHQPPAKRARLARAGDRRDLVSARRERHRHVHRGQRALARGLPRWVGRAANGRRCGGGRDGRRVRLADRRGAQRHRLRGA